MNSLVFRIMFRIERFSDVILRRQGYLLFHPVRLILTYQTMKCMEHFETRRPYSVFHIFNAVIRTTHTQLHIHHP